MKKFNSVLLLILTSLVLVFIVYSVYKLSLYNLIQHDDNDFFWSKDLSMSNDISIFTRYYRWAYRAKLISNAVILFFGFDLPSFFNIHPYCWIQTGGGIIKGVFWAVFSFLLTSSLFIFNKKNLFFPVLLLLNYVFLQFKYTNRFQNELYASFYCFVFPFIFFFIFWQLFIKIYTNVITFNKPNKLFLFISGVLVGMSSEMTAITTFFALMFIAIKSIINKNIQKGLLLISFISTIIGNLLYFLHPFFLFSAEEKGTLKGFRQTIDAAATIFPEYIAGYKDTFIHYFLPYLIIIAICTLLVCFYADKTIKNKVLSVSLSLLSGCFVFFTMLLFAGRPMDHTAVVHYDLIVQMLISFLFIIYILSSSIINNKKVFYTSFVTVTLLILLFNINQIIGHIKEKDYYYNNLLFNSVNSFLNGYKNEFLISYYGYKNMPVKVFDIGGTGPVDILKKIKTLYNENYDLNNEVEFVETMEDSIDIYYKNGGRYVSDEEFEKADFQKLLDKNFVLNGESSVK